MKTKIGYWVATAMLCLAMGLGGIADLLLLEPVQVIFDDLGYPSYFGRILGFWKLLAVLAILAPGWPRLKEWAYAGVVFDLTGAAVSHFASGSPTKEMVTPLVLLAVAAASYLLRPPSRRLE